MKQALSRFKSQLSTLNPRVLKSLVILLTLALIVEVVSFSLFLRSAFAAQATNRAAVVIVYGENKVTERCVEFSGDQITGLDLLLQAGPDVVIDASNAIGSAVCKIRDKGCDYPGENCFCKCQGGDCTYWSYWNWTGGNWTYAEQGTSNRAIHNGDMDGWVWGIGTVDGAQPPPSDKTFEQICAVAPATATATATLSETPTQTATTTTTVTTTATATRTLTVTRTPSLSRTPSLTRTPRPPTNTRVAQQQQDPLDDSDFSSVPTREPPPPPDLNNPPPPNEPPVVPQASEAPSPEPPSAGFGLPTRVRVTPTRARLSVSQAQAGGDNPRSGNQPVNSDSAESVDTLVLSGLVVGGGLLVGGVGFLFLLGGLVWYWYKRRYPY